MRPKTIVLILVASLLAACMSERIAKESLLSCEDMFGRDHENCAPYDPNEGT